MPLDQSHSVSSTVEAGFPLRGSHVPADHGAQLYAALCGPAHLGDWLAAADDVAIAPIAGRPEHTDLLALTPESRLMLRLPAAELPRVLGLVGRRIEVGGHGIELCPPQVETTRPAADLHADLVAFDQPAAGGDPAAFLGAVRRQLASLEIAAEPLLRATGALHLPGRVVPGYALAIGGLSPDDSIHLQEAGLGDHRKLGCGVFVPG